MTLRDWFAGQALIQAVELTRSNDGVYDAAEAAEWAYALANAMMAERAIQEGANG